MEENRKIVFLGYSQSGKTKILFQLVLHADVVTIPTIGCSREISPPHPPPPLILPRGGGGVKFPCNSCCREEIIDKHSYNVFQTTSTDESSILEGLNWLVSQVKPLDAASKKNTADIQNED